MKTHSMLLHLLPLFCLCVHPLQALEVCAEKKKRILLIQQEIKTKPVSQTRTGKACKRSTVQLHNLHVSPMHVS